MTMRRGLAGFLLMLCVGVGLAWAQVQTIPPSGGGAPVFPQYTIDPDTRPVGVPRGYTIEIIDGANGQDCTVGGGSTSVQCKWNGTAWAAFGDGNTAGAGGAPETAPYVTMGADPTLSAECVVATCLIMRGTHGARPAASASFIGRLYFYSDSPFGFSYQVDATTWEDRQLDWGQITAKSIVNAEISGAAAIAKSKISTAGTWPVADIPSLAASIITSGELNADRIPTLAKSKINAAGTWEADDIPSLAASIITSGTFDAARIPPLNASILDAGTLNAARLPLPTATTLGGVRSGSCAGADKISAIATDGTVTCTPDVDSAGEASTPFSMTNVGVAGIGIHKQTLNEVYELRNLNSADGDITVTLDAANNEIDFDLGFDPATQTELDTHTSDSTNVHGITDAANLVYTNDSRLSDTRTPTAHAASHNPLGTDPIDGTYATKAYVDALAQGLDPKDAAGLATTTNITLSGEQTIDGSLTVSDRVLVKNQLNKTENGLYVSGSGAWTRTTDADTAGEIETMYVFVQSGTTQANTGWVLSTDPPITLGSTDLEYTQFSGAVDIIAGQALTKTGTTLDVGAGTCLTATANDIGVSANCLTATQIQTAAATGFADSNAAGSASTLARSDHTHKRDVKVGKNGSPIATRNKVNFVEGTGVTLSVDDDAGNDEVDVTITASSATLPSGGSANQFLKRTNDNSSEEWGNLLGTEDQIDVMCGAGGCTFSLPQDIATSSSPTLAGLALNQGTLTASTPLTHTVTFNNAAVTFVGQTNAFTRTAAADASILQRWTVDGATKTAIGINGKVTVQSLKTNLVTITTNYTLADDVTYVMCDASSGTVTITFPDASARGLGSPVYAKKIDSSANHCILTRAGSDTFEGATSIALQIQYQGRHMVPAGADLWVVGLFQ